MRLLALLSILASGALAQSSAYGQCGGQGWTGATTCVSGYVCTYANDWYSQCLPGTATTTSSVVTVTTATATSSTAAATTTFAASGSFKWFGVDESVAEFGSDNYPGTWGIDFYFPSNTSIQVSSMSLLVAKHL